MDLISLSERLMEKGWWSAAAEILSRDGIHPAERNLQSASLICRQECARIAATCGLQGSVDDLRAYLLKHLDRYTVAWYFDRYIGEGYLEWLKRSADSAQMD